MKKLTIITAGILILSACGPSAEDLRKRCNNLLEYPEVSAYYPDPLIQGWKQGVVDCADDVECLNKAYELLLDKAATAKAEIEIQKRMSH